MKRIRTLLLSGVLALLLPLGPAFAVPAIEHWSTGNGARVFFIAAPELPIVDAMVVFDAGSARDGAKPGLAQLTNVLLDSGTAELSADAVAERLDGVGAQLGGDVDRDMASVSLRSLSDPKYLTPSIETVAGLLEEPAFAPQSLERERNRLLTAVEQRAQSPQDIAEEAFFKAVYGDHPYASPPEGDKAGLSAVTREDVQDFHRRYYVAANAVVALVGDLDRAGAERIANTLVGGLPTGEAAPPLPTVEPVKQAQVLRIFYPSSQTHVLIGQTGIARGDPDYFRLYLGNHALGGGGLSSRLMQEVREKRGLSYGVYSYFYPLRQAGPFIVGLQTRNDQAPEAISVVESTLQDFIANGPGAERLKMARQNITGGFALRIDSNSKLVQYLSVIGFYHLPLDYLQRFPERIDAVSPEEVTDAFRRRVHPERLITVIVGGDQAGSDQSR